MKEILESENVEGSASDVKFNTSTKEEMICYHLIAFALEGTLIDPNVSWDVLSEPETPVVAIITGKPDDYLLNHDCSLAIADGLLTAVFGNLDSSSFEDWLDARVAIIRQSRWRSYERHPFLLITRTFQVSVELKQYRELLGSLVSFDLVDKTAVRDATGYFTDRLLASVALAYPALTGFKKVADAVYLQRKGGQYVFSYSPTAHAVGVIARSISKDDIAQVPTIFGALTAIGSTRRAIDVTIDRATNLLRASIEEQEDLLRTFLFGWQALEILAKDKSIQNHFRSVVDRQATIPRSAFGGFQVLCMALHPSGLDSDLESFRRIQDIRNAFVHGDGIDESGLPVEDVRRLALKYVKLCILERV